MHHSRLLSMIPNQSMAYSKLTSRQLLFHTAATALTTDRFHPEVTHTPRGTELLRNFAVEICEARQHWTMDEFVGKEIARIRALVGEKGQVIGAVSGGVDSTVAAKLMNEAIGPRFHAILVGGRSLL